VVLVVLVAWLLFRTRRSEGYTNAEVLAPAGFSVKAVGLAGCGYLGNPNLTSLNSIVATLNSTYPTLLCSTYSTMPTFSGSETSMPFTDRVVLRALAFTPLVFKTVCGSINVTASGSATVAQAAQAFGDMYNLGVRGDTTIGLTNLNGAIGSNTPFASQQDFINRFNTSDALDASVVYLLGFILSGFNSWLSGITFDTTFNPLTYLIPASGVCVKGAHGCAAGLTCDSGTCKTSTCTNGGVTCSSGQTCVNGTCTNNCGTSGGSYCATSGQTCVNGACTYPCGTNGGSYCATSGQVCNGSSCTYPCGTSGGSYCSDTTKKCLNNQCQVPTCANGGLPGNSSTQYCGADGQWHNNLTAGSGSVAQSLIGLFS